MSVPGDDLSALLSEADKVDGTKPAEPVAASGPLGDTTPAYQPDAEIIGALKMVWSMAGEGLAVYHGSDHWKLTDAQGNQLAVASERVMDKYLGKMAEFPCELTLLIAIGMTFGPAYIAQGQRNSGGDNGKESKPE